MVLKRVSFLLTLINAIFARPEKPIQAFVTPCNVWALHGEYVKDYSESIQTNFFNYFTLKNIMYAAMYRLRFKPEKKVVDLLYAA